MKRIFSRSFVLSLCLLLSLPVVADAFLGRAKPSAPASELVGAWKLESFANVPKPVDEFELFKDGTGIFKDAQLRQAGMPAGVGVSGTWRVENNRLILMFGGLGMTVDYTLSDSGSKLTVIYDKNTNAHAIYLNVALMEQARAEAMRKAGFIAQSESLMNWSDAKAFCARHGGRLPRIQGRDSLSGSEFQQMFESTFRAAGFSWQDVNSGNVDESRIIAAIAAAGILIDGFGAMARPWAEVALPTDFYWTGTENSDDPDLSWFVGDFGGNVNVASYPQGNDLRVVCVP